MPKTLTLLIAAGALGAAVAGCGSGSTASGVVQAPSGGPISDSTTSTASTTSSTTTPAATVPTPKTGPLSKQPTISAGGSNPPKSLQVENLVTGTGTTAKAGDQITVNYVGALYKNGKVFDSSWSRNETFATSLTTATASGGGVIAGWVKGVAGMKVGGRRQLVIPPSLAYGKQATNGIPANSTLVFDIDLLKVQP